MKKVLICSIDNENLKNFNPLLENDNDLRFTFLDLSNLHKNQINYNNSAKIICSSISLKKPFYLLNILERLKAIYLFKKEIKNIIHEYDIVICGRIGILEYELIKYLKKNFQTLAYSINDSILIYHEQANLFKKLRLILYGFKVRQNICDKIFVSGQVSKQTLIKDGVNENKIIISGLPRFKKYFDQSFAKRQKNSNNSLLVLTGAHKWTGYNEWQIDQDNFLKKLNSLNLNHLSINIKPHPRDNFNFKQLKNLNILNEKMDIDKVIDNHDIVICATSLSTGLIQAGLLNKKTLFVKTRELDHIMDNFNFYISNFPTIDKNEIDANFFLKAEKNKHNILNQYISEKSLYSPEIILNEIK